ncbi:YciI family protein [Candidatus Odyssella thessalonicensis]|uniref:YciI family protein n=1 Tax=Candidatus Odyssella thessalonicensis TaxID=84647 RepID=UPI000225B446|nr:YciI family protein [Candidatus Odyssella thessalonicensis]
MTHRLFIIKLHYIVPIEQVDLFIIPHREHLDAYYQSGHFLASGPQIPRTGGIIIAKAKDRAEIEQIMNRDPFSIEKIAKYEIIEFEAIKSSKILEQFWDQ